MRQDEVKLKNIMSRTVQVLRTGLLEYGKSMKLQKFLAQGKFNPINDPIKFKNVLILTEHKPVYTVGIRTQQYSDDEKFRLKELGAEFFKTNRGGLITFHGPGQLVVYPILHLKNFQPSMRWYVHQLESVVIDCCKKYDINAGRTQDTGIWVQDRKICAIGIHGKMFITTHGIALNCNTDLTWFNHIVPCGIEGKRVTSITNELGKNIEIKDAIPYFLETFKNYFECNLVEFSEKETLEILNSYNE